MSNSYAPIYDPQIWDKGSSAEELFQAASSYVRKRGMRSSLPGFLEFLDLMSLFEKVREGKVPREPNHDLYAQKYLSMNFNQAVALYDHMAPHLDGPLYRSNCYAYALNDMTRIGIRDRFDPGMRAGLQTDWMSLQKSASKEDFVSALITNCEADGLEFIGNELVVPEGAYPVACYAGINPRTGLRDSHFVRQDHDGGYSHKGGSVKVSRLDFNNSPIQNPTKANFTAAPVTYNFAGYFLVRP